VDEEALATGEKSARRQHALIVFEDESGVSLLPSVRATWAPGGQTPVLRHRFVWKRLSIASALVYEPDGSDARLAFELRPGAYNTETLIEFLTFLHELEAGRSVILLGTDCPRTAAAVCWTERGATAIGCVSSRCLAMRRTSTPLSKSGAISSPPNSPTSASTRSERSLI
jgi:hypothetical protein